MKKVITHLSFQVLVAIVLGLLFGLYFPNYASSAKLLSQTFINMITMLIAPIIFFTIVLGISSMDNMHKVGRVGGKALLYFEVITTFAIVIGLVVANIFKPGVGVDMAITDVAKVKEYQAGASQIEWGSFIAHIVPHNIVESFAKGDILQILFFAILFGTRKLHLTEQNRGVMVAIAFESVVKLFALLMLVAAVMMWRSKPTLNQAPLPFNYAKIIVDGLIVGIVTGFVGVGGGFLVVQSLGGDDQIGAGLHYDLLSPDLGPSLDIGLLCHVRILS